MGSNLAEIPIVTTKEFAQHYYQHRYGSIDVEKKDVITQLNIILKDRVLAKLQLVLTAMGKYRRDVEELEVLTSSYSSAADKALVLDRVEEQVQVINQSQFNFLRQYR